MKLLIIAFFLCILRRTVSSFWLLPTGKLTSKIFVISACMQEKKLNAKGFVKVISAGSLFSIGPLNECWEHYWLKRYKALGQNQLHACSWWVSEQPFALGNSKLYSCNYNTGQKVCLRIANTQYALSRTSSHATTRHYVAFGTLKSYFWPKVHEIWAAQIMFPSTRMSVLNVFLVVMLVQSAF